MVNVSALMNKNEELRTNFFQIYLFGSKKHKLEHFDTTLSNVLNAFFSHRP